MLPNKFQYASLEGCSAKTNLQNINRRKELQFNVSTNVFIGKIHEK